MQSQEHRQDNRQENRGGRDRNYNRDSRETDDGQHKIDPVDNILHISRNKGSFSYIFIARIFFQKFETIELHGLGEATRTVAIVAEELRRKGDAEILKIETETFSPPEGDEKRRGGKKVKLKVTLKVNQESRDRFKKELEERDRERQNPNRGQQYKQKQQQQD